jgi:polyisoprenoid-binding protein YceI
LTALGPAQYGPGEREALEKVLSDADREAVVKNMLGPDQLDAAKFPMVSFRSTQIVRGEGDAWMVTGELTLHGVTKKITLPVTLKRDGASYVGDGKLTLQPSSYGIEPYSAMLGAIRVKDQADLHLHIVAREQGAATP